MVASRGRSERSWLFIAPPGGVTGSIAVGCNGSRAGQDGQDAAGCVAAGGKGITSMSRFRTEELDVAMLVWGGWRRRTGDDAAAETVAKRGARAAAIG